MAAGVEFDSQLPVIEAVQQGDHYAFKEFLRHQDRWVRGVAFAVLGDPDRVDDVTQQVWASVWERASELRDVRRWRSWLYRLTRNAAVDAGREATRRKRLAAGLVEQTRQTDSAGAPVETLLKDEKHRTVLRAIQLLPALYREPFTLRHLEGWSYRQIAEVLEVPVDTVETRLVRARRQLREALSGKV